VPEAIEYIKKKVANPPLVEDENADVY